jgi:hypothetical protein
VTVSASIPQRILGFGDVVVDNASEIGGSTILHNINTPRHYADLLLRELRPLALNSKSEDSSRNSYHRWNIATCAGSK